MTRGPLQIVSALEAIDFFHVNRSELLTFATPGALELIQAAELDLGELATSPARVLRGGSSHLEVLLGLRRSKQALSEALNGRSIERFFFGTNGALARTLYGSFSTQLEPVVLEDGVASLRTNRRAELLAESRILSSARARSMALRTLGVPTSPIPQLTFFTHYSIEVGPDDTLCRNEFLHLKTENESSREIDETFTIILGTYAQGRNDYLDRAYGALSLTKSSQRIAYKPHPSERTLPNLEEHVQLLPAGVPIELLVGTMDKLPKRIIALGSSALTTLRMLLPDAVELYDLSDPST